MSVDSSLSAAWTIPPAEYALTRPATYRLAERPMSCYLTMRDGCRIAIDLYLPQPPDSDS